MARVGVSIGFYFHPPLNPFPSREGRDTFYRLFLQGHAVKNYYFFVPSDRSGDYKKRQKHILLAVGKFLKRTSLIAEDLNTELVEGFLSELKDQNSTVFIFKLIHSANLQFYRTFTELYSEKRLLSPGEELYIEDVVKRYNIDRYQQERMKIDIMYRHPDNKRVVDEYRGLLLSGISKDTFQNSEFARLRRLRTLGIRNDIARELAEKGIVTEVSKKLFAMVFIDLGKESFYLNHLLPLIIQNKDTALREDFLNNSGLDRFYIEMLEKEYFENRKLDFTLLESIRDGGGLSHIGGGERI